MSETGNRHRRLSPADSAAMVRYLSDMTRRSRSVLDLKPRTFRAIWMARHKGMSWRKIERKFNLLPNNGMTAYRAFHRAMRQPGGP